LPGGRTVRWQAIGGQAHRAESLYCPEFGVRQTRTCLEIGFAPGSQVKLELSW
jgi:hypothetical protein